MSESEYGSEANSRNAHAFCFFTKNRDDRLDVRGTKCLVL